MKKGVVVYFLLITIFAAGTSALAQPPIDKARRSELIRKFDVNGDGVLSAEEIEKAQKPGLGREKERIRESKREAPIRNDERMQRLLERFDKDGNGKLSFSEMAALREAERQRRAAGQERDTIVMEGGRPEADRP